MDISVLVTSTRAVRVSRPVGIRQVKLIVATSRDITGLPPLAAAIKLGNIEEAQRLINAGARADIRGPTYGNLAHLAAARSDHQIHEIFPLLKLVIEAGADPNAPGPDPENESLLCFIIRDVFLHDYRHAICRYLVEEVGVDVNMRSQSGTYPIITATALTDRPLVHYLIEKGADVDVSDFQGKRPAHYAVPSASNRSIGSLIKAGVDLLVPDYYGRTPLHFAAVMCGWEFIGIFIDFLPGGYNINVRDDDGWTPLMWACKNTRSDALKIEILVKVYGADVWPLSYDGQWSALKLAHFARMDAEALKCLEPPEHERERILEDGTREVWDPDFHQTIPGEHHHYNSCSNCRVVSHTQDSIPGLLLISCSSLRQGHFISAQIAQSSSCYVLSVLDIVEGCMILSTRWKSMLNRRCQRTLATMNLTSETPLRGKNTCLVWINNAPRKKESRR